jgi:hypothetical protein
MIMSKKLIKNRQFNVGIVESYKAKSEDKGHGIDSPILGEFFVKGMTVENTISQNRTKYPTEAWSQRNAFGSGGKFLDESGKLKPATLFGSVDHPTDDRAELLLSEAAIAWYDVKRNDDGSWDGKADVLNNPQGKIVKTFLEYAKERGGSGLLGVSSRALGETRLEESSDGQYESIVPESFELMSFDFVYNPSFQTATAVLNESAKGGRKTLTESIKALAKEDEEHADVYNKVIEDLEQRSKEKSTKKESKTVDQAKKEYYKTLRAKEKDLYNALYDLEEMSEEDFKKEYGQVDKAKVEKNMKAEYEEVLAEIQKLKEPKVENRKEDNMPKEKINEKKVTEAKMYNIELPKDKAKKLAQALKDENIYYEPSSAGDLIHFEIKCDETQKEAIEKFLQTISESVEIIKESTYVINEENKTIGDFVDEAKEKEKDLFGEEDEDSDEDSEGEEEDEDLEELEAEEEEDLDGEEEEDSEEDLEEEEELSVEDQIKELRDLVQQLVDFLMPVEDPEAELLDDDLEGELSEEEDDLELEDSEGEEDSEEDGELLGLEELTDEDLDDLTDEELEALLDNIED